MTTTPTSTTLYTIHTKDVEPFTKLVILLCHAEQCSFVMMGTVVLCSAHCSKEKSKGVCL